MILNAFSFLLRAGDGIVDSEDVVGVDRVLDLLLPVYGHFGQGPVDELFPDFADAVMVTDRAAAKHHFISSAVFNLVVPSNNVLFVHSLMIH